MHIIELVDATELRQVVEGGETFTVEFKGGRGLNDRMIVESVVCLTNGEGGMVLLGVADDGTIEGVAPRHGDVTDPHMLRALVLNKTEPPIASRVEVVDVDGVDVVVVEVERSPTPVGTTSGMFVRRSTKTDGSPECRPFRAHEIVAAGFHAHGRDYAETPARGSSADDLDRGELQRFREMCRRGKGDRSLGEATDEDILGALRLRLPGSNELTLGAMLLFGTAPALSAHVPTAETLFQVRRGSDLEVNEQLRHPLLFTAQRIFDLLDARNSEQEVVVGMHRFGIPRLPDTIVREAVANAMVHRDYASLGPISVRLDDDRLRVRSPGGLPAGITLSNILEDSQPRSVVLADAFKRAGIVDRNGRGVEQMYLSLLRLGRSGPDYSATNDSAVTVTVPTSDADLEMVRFVVEHEDATGDRLLLAHLRLLHELKALGACSIPDLTQLLSVSDSHVRADLTRMGEMGLVEGRGTGRGRRFHLTAAFHRLAESTEYVRLRDTDPIQQGQMVLTYVEQFGQITRGTTAQLCRLSPQQASLLLRRLVEEGSLELRGERRGAHYVLSS